MAQSHNVRLPAAAVTAAALLLLAFDIHVPGLGVGFVAVHRGLYRQSGWFTADCADRAEAALRRKGWARVGRDGAISTWQAPS